MDKSLKIDKDVRKKLYIKVYYSLLDWEWYDEPNTFRVFMHLLLTANRKDNKIHGKLIRRGESLASLGHIAASTGLSIQNVRTAINNLLSTQEITQRKIGKYCVYTINSYNRLQSDNTISNNNPTRCQQGYNTTATQSQHNANKVPTTPIDCKNDNSDKSVRLTECVRDTHAHGTLNNVLLTDDEYARFTERYPLIAKDVINQLSEKIATGDPKYQTGHIGHLYQFARYNVRQKQNDDAPSYNIELALQRALNIDPNKQ